MVHKDRVIEQGCMTTTTTCNGNFVLRRSEDQTRCKQALCLQCTVDTRSAFTGRRRRSRRRHSRASRLIRPAVILTWDDGFLQDAFQDCPDVKNQVRAGSR